jgi:hypothetical protein
MMGVKNIGRTASIKELDYRRRGWNIAGVQAGDGWLERLRLDKHAGLGQKLIVTSS